MTNKEYAELLDYINERNAEQLDSVNMYKAFSTYNPKTNQIEKVTLKLNYTKDGTPLPDLTQTKLTKSIRKNLVLRTEQFRGDDCNLNNIKDFIDSFMDDEKRC